MKSKYLILILIVAVFITIGVGSILVVKNNQHEEDVHLHAGFVVFKDNKQIDFSDPKYMMIKPCSIAEVEHEETDEEKQIEKAHLHGQIGDVVHVEREGVEWNELFTNLNYKIDYSKVEAYLNNNKVENFQDEIIEPYDSLVVLIGSSDYEKISSKAATLEHIKEAEEKSEDCG